MTRHAQTHAAQKLEFGLSGHRHLPNAETTAAPAETKPEQEHAFQKPAVVLAS